MAEDATMHEQLKGRIVQATICCKVGAAALVHLRPVLGFLYNPAL